MATLAYSTTNPLSGTITSILPTDTRITKRSMIPLAVGTPAYYVNDAHSLGDDNPPAYSIEFDTDASDVVLHLRATPAASGVYMQWWVDGTELTSGPTAPSGVTLADGSEFYGHLAMGAAGTTRRVLVRGRFAAIYSVQVPGAGGPTEDSFDRADSTGLGSDWTHYTATLNVVSNQAAATTTGAGAAFHNTTTSGDDQAVQAVLTAGGGNSMGVVGNAPSSIGTDDTTTGEFYLWRYNGTAWGLLRKGANASTYTSLGSLTESVTYPVTVRLEREGTALRGYANGVLKVSVTDSTPITGQRRGGIRTNGSTAVRFDDFVLDTIPATPTTTAATVSATPITRQRISAVGASFTATNAATGYHHLTAWPWAFGDDTRVVADVLQTGVNGTGHIGTNAYSAAARVARNKTFDPKYVVIEGSGNDDAATYTDINNGAAATFSAYATELPNAKLIVFGALPRGDTGTLSAGRATNLKAVRDAALAASNVIRFVDPVGMAAEGTVPAAYASGANYAAGDKVTYVGAVYQAKTALTNVPATLNTADWTLLSWYTGTGHAGTPTGDGNRDTYVGDDDTHPTAAGQAFFADMIAAGFQAATAPPAGTASGTWANTGSATGTSTRAGTASGSWANTGSATGSAARVGTATGSWAYAGSATGGVVTSGSASGTWTNGGSASGSATRSGSASGSWATTGSASGVTTRTGTASGSWTRTASASGSAPLVDGASGTAAGSWTRTGAATGAVAKVGAASGSWVRSGTATGASAHVGTATGAWERNGAAVGRSAPSGTTGGTWVISGTAAGKTDRYGSAMGSYSWTGSASGLNADEQGYVVVTTSHGHAPRWSTTVTVAPRWTTTAGVSP